MEIHTIGGYEEVGKNMTAIKIDDDVIICDMGLHLESFIHLTEEEDIHNLDKNELIRDGAVPDISKIMDWKKNVRIILSTHAHLDHIGAIPFLANEFQADILATPFTVEVLRQLLEKDNFQLKNKIKTINLNSSYKVNENITVEFINMTHSTPQTAMIAIHTKYGIIVYANDFKFDNYPTLGMKANIKRLKELGKEGNVIVLICDSTYAYEKKKTPSEAVAKQMLKDVLLGTDSSKKAVIVTTFASHLARLKSIIHYGEKMGRKVVLMGRSMARYTEAGEKVGIVNFSKEVEIIKYKKQIKRRLKKITQEGKDKYLLVMTGHQGEPGSTLDGISKEELGFNLEEGDHVVFSCTVIPSLTNQRNRHKLEEYLIKKKVRIFKDIHVSGHAAREDLRDLITYVKPKHIVPAHGEIMMTSALYELAQEMGYKEHFLHLLHDGARFELDIKQE